MLVFLFNSRNQFAAFPFQCVHHSLAGSFSLLCNLLLCLVGEECLGLPSQFINRLVKGLNGFTESSGEFRNPSVQFAQRFQILFERIMLRLLPSGRTDAAVNLIYFFRKVKPVFLHCTRPIVIACIPISVSFPCSVPPYARTALPIHGHPHPLYAPTGFPHCFLHHRMTVQKECPSSQRTTLPPCP